MTQKGRTPVEVEPIARVLPMLSVPHLDREFDYLVSAEQSDDAQPGVRVRVRFHGRLVDGFILERRNDTDHTGKLGWLDRVVSAEPVLTAEIRRLVDAVAARYAGTRPDVLRLAARARHARVEREPASAQDPLTRLVSCAGRPVGLGGLRPSRGTVLGRPGRVACRARRLARRCRASCGRTDSPKPRRRPCVRGARRWRSCPTSATWTRCGVPRRPGSTNTAWWHSRPGWGRPRATGGGWRRCAAARGSVIGTRSAVFAPLSDLGLVMVWADSDDTLVEPRAPYLHAREVAMLRAHQARCAALIGGYSQTAEAHALVRGGWAHDVVAARPVVRARTPRVVALDDSGYAEARDPAARTARLPSIALRAARSALEAGAPVLVQVPRRGYVPSLACARCRSIARCRHCTGPLSLMGSLQESAGPGPARSAVCRWCGRAEPTLRCARCGSEGVRAVVVGARRTAEELGRAFPGTPVVTSAGDVIVTEVEARPALVVATPGAEPHASGGYGAALLLDTWGVAGPAGPARCGGRPVALDVRGRTGAGPGRGRRGDDRR